MNSTRPTDCPDWLWSDRTARAMLQMGRPVDAVYEAVERLAIQAEGCSTLADVKNDYSMMPRSNE